MDGQPPINLVINGVTHGDVATAVGVVNCIPRVLNAELGLMTMKDLPDPTVWFARIEQFIKKGR